MLAFLMFLLVSLPPPDQGATTPVISPTAFRAWFDAATWRSAVDPGRS